MANNSGSRCFVYNGAKLYGQKRCAINRPRRWMLDAGYWINAGYSVDLINRRRATRCASACVGRATLGVHGASVERPCYKLTTFFPKVLTSQGFVYTSFSSNLFRFIMIIHKTNSFHNINGRIFQPIN